MSSVDWKFRKSGYFLQRPFWVVIAPNSVARILIFEGVAHRQLSVSQSTEYKKPWLSRIGVPGLRMKRNTASD